MAYRGNRAGRGELPADVARIKALLFQVPAPSSGSGTEHSVLAGNGLTGGGQLTADVTLDVGAGNGITVSANSIAVNQGYGFSWTAAQTWAAGATFNAGLTVNSAVATFNYGAALADGYYLTFGGDVGITRKAANILTLAAGDDIESNTFASGFSGWRIQSTGDAEFNSVNVRGAIKASVFEKSVVSAFAGSLIVSKSAGKLSVNFSVANSGVPFANPVNLFVETPSAGGWAFATGDIIRIKAEYASGVGDTWMTVTRTANVNEYTVVVNYGSVGITYPAGTGIADYGPSGSGFLTMTADGTFGSSANLSIGTHAGTPWTALTLKVRLGNMNGSYGTGANNRYGIGIGDYTGGNYLSYNAETADAFRIKAGGGDITIDGDGQRFAVGADDTSYARWLSSTTEAARIGVDLDGGDTFASIAISGLSSGNPTASLRITATDYDGTTTARLDIFSYNGLSTGSDLRVGQSLAVGTEVNSADTLGAKLYVTGVANNKYGIHAIKTHADGYAAGYFENDDAGIYAALGSNQYAGYFNALTYIEILRLGDGTIQTPSGKPALFYQGGDDTAIVALNSSDVDHGMTTWTETENYMIASKYNATNGGFTFIGFSAATVAAEIAGFGTTDNTTKSTSGVGYVSINAAKKSSTTVTTPGADANIFVVRSAGSTKFILDADGDSHQDVGTAWTNFDDHDDLALLNLFSAHVTRESDPLRTNFSAWLEQSREPLERLNLVTFNYDGHHFVNWSRMSMLEIGAIRQLGDELESAYQQITKLEERVKLLERN